MRLGLAHESRDLPRPGSGCGIESLFAFQLARSLGFVRVQFATQLIHGAVDRVAQRLKFVVVSDRAVSRVLTASDRFEVLFKSIDRASDSVGDQNAD